MNSASGQLTCIGLKIYTGPWTVAGRALPDAKVRIAVPIPYTVARRAVLVQDVQRIPPVCRPAAGPHHRLRLPQE